MLKVGGTTLPQNLGAQQGATLLALGDAASSPLHCHAPWVQGALPGWAHPIRGRIRAAGPLLLVELHTVEEAGGSALHAEGLHLQLDGKARAHLNAPDAECVGWVGAGVVGRAEGALGALQGPATGCTGQQHGHEIVLQGTAVLAHRPTRDLPGAGGAGVPAVGSQLWVGVAAVLGAGGALRVGATVVELVPWAGRAAAGALGGCRDVSSVPREEQGQLSPSREKCCSAGQGLRKPTQSHVLCSHPTPHVCRSWGIPHSSHRAQ